MELKTKEISEIVEELEKEIIKKELEDVKNG